MPKPTGPCFLYRFFDEDGGLLYTGIATSPLERWTAHKSDKAWWPRVARIEADRYRTRMEAAEAERQAIRSETPQHNVAGVPGRWPSRRRTDPLSVEPFTASRPPALAEEPSGDRAEIFIGLEDGAPYVVVNETTVVELAEWQRLHPRENPKVRAHASEQSARAVYTYAGRELVDPSHGGPELGVGGNSRPYEVVRLAPGLCIRLSAWRALNPWWQPSTEVNAS